MLPGTCLLELGDDGQLTGIGQQTPAVPEDQ